MRSDDAVTVNDAAVVVAYLALIGAAIFHAVVLLPAYELLEFHYYLILATSLLIIIGAVWRIWVRVTWETTW